MSQKCSHLTRLGEPCRAWAVRGSLPPRCAAHGGRVPGATGPQELVGQAQVAGQAQVENQAQTREGSLDLNAVIYDLAEKHAQVSALIDRFLESPETINLGELLRLMQHHAQTASRLTIRQPCERRSQRSIYSPLESNTGPPLSSRAW